MKISEDGIIEFLKKINLKADPKTHWLGIGDDAALFPLDSNHSYVYTVDTLVEGVHFRKQWSGAQDLAHKCLQVNLSDVASMGAQALACFLTLSLPKNLNSHWLKVFLKTFSRELKKRNIILLGGNTTRSPHHIFIDCAVLAKVKNRFVKKRTGAKPGDWLCLSRPTGLSRAGLCILKQKNKNTKFSQLERFFIHAHCRPRAEENLSCTLSQESGVTAMMDVSDGLALDLPKLLKASNVGAKINCKNIPIHPKLKKLCENKKWNALDMAWYGGEDYALLFTIKNSALNRFKLKFKKQKREIFVLGQCTRQRVLNIHLKKTKSASFFHF
jgi:thiamine-monophosphate kinase